MGRTPHTPERLRALRIRQERRLVALTNSLMTAAEAMKATGDFAGVEKQAKALIAVRRALSEIYTQNSPCEEMDMNDERNRDSAPKPDDLDAWKLVLERKLDRLADTRAKAALDRPAPEPLRDRGDADELAVLGV